MDQRPEQSQQTTMIPEQGRIRTPNACDACRARKVKCHYEGLSCRGCLNLDISCTQNRSRKKRGPENSYAKRQKELRHQLIPLDTPSPVFGPPLHNWLSQLGTLPVILQIIDDWFELIHSVAPLLHRAQFLERLTAGDADRDPAFCGLVISTIVAVVVSLKRKSSKNYGTITMETCLAIIKQNQLLEQDHNYTLEWCQAKYNLGTAVCSERGLDDVEGFRYFGEAVMGMKYLIHYQLPNMPMLPQQLLKRLYWLLFAGQCTLEIYLRPSAGLVSPKDNLEVLRPLDIVDNELYVPVSFQSTPWHGDTTSYIPGLIFLSDLFLIWQSSQRIHGSISQLQQHVEQVQRALDDLPTELRWRGGLSRPPRSNFGTDVQVVNLYITQLHIRSNLLEQIQHLSTAQPCDTQTAENISQRQGIVDDLLEILSHMSRETLEANGHSLVPKIRDIGSVLLDEITMERGETKSISGKARDDLERLLGKLEDIDFRPGLSGTTTGD